MLEASFGAEYMLKFSYLSDFSSEDAVSIQGLRSCNAVVSEIYSKKTY